VGKPFWVWDWSLNHISMQKQLFVLLGVNLNECVMEFDVYIN
jgi:hypothetical protein